MTGEKTLIRVLVCVAAALAAASLVACDAEDTPSIQWRLDPVKTLTGFKVPECVVADPENALAQEGGKPVRL